MSLIASASPWVNDDPTVAQLKRIATMKKPAVPTPLPNASSTNTDIRTFSIDNEEVDRPSRITELVNKITSDDPPPSKLSLHADNAGNDLADFAPRVFPSQTVATDDWDSRNTGIQLESPPIRNTVLPSPPFAPNPNHTAKLSNYRQSYETPPMRGGIPNGTNSIVHGSTNDVKIADRLSHIIHLLEEMKNEKTSNVTEEFVLYSLLGIFVIYLVDAFARTGKYTR